LQEETFLQAGKTTKMVKFRAGGVFRGRLAWTAGSRSKRPVEAFLVKMIYQGKCHIPCLKALFGGYCHQPSSRIGPRKPILRYPGAKNGLFLQRTRSPRVGEVEAVKLQELWPEAKGTSRRSMSDFLSGNPNLDLSTKIDVRLPAEEARVATKTTRDYCPASNEALRVRARVATENRPRNKSSEVKKLSVCARARCKEEGNGK